MPDKRPSTTRRADNRIFWGGGALLLGIVTALVAPKVVSKARLTARRATGITYRSGFSHPGVRATVDPARGIAA